MQRIAFVWDNFGFMHNERLEAVAHALGIEGEVTGIELFSGSQEYGWRSRQSQAFRKVTLFSGYSQDPPSSISISLAVVRACLNTKAKTVFMCGHGLRGIFAASLLLRICGCRLVALNNSKFDDRPRFVFKELLKAIYYIPYGAALVSSHRAAEYFRFLGFRSRPIKLFYNNRSLTRIRDNAEAPPAPAGLPHAKRVFLCVARLTKKKNHKTLLQAYALYAKGSRNPRPLVLCGSGPLEGDLRALVIELGVGNLVEFRGWQSEAEVAHQLARSLALILCSTEEQFGIVVIEALAMGVPPIVTENVGARDLFVRTGINGILVEPDNPEGLAMAMTRLAEDEALWARLAMNAQRRADDEADIDHFVESVLSLAGCEKVLAIPETSNASLA